MMMVKKLFLLVTFFTGSLLLNATVLSSSVWAKYYVYQGKIEGMVCAFCAYNVSKKISQLAGVNITSVNIDLKSGQFDFLASSSIQKQRVSTVFSDSGFTLVEFNQRAFLSVNPINFSKEPLITLNFENNSIKKLETVLDSVGNLAASQTSLLNIKAPKAIENDLLTPLLAGRQKVIKVIFVPVESNIINIEIFTPAEENK